MARRLSSNCMPSAQPHSSTAPADAETLARLAQQLFNEPFAVESWPPGGRALTLLELIARHAPEAALELQRAMLLAQALVSVPIVAVAGLNDQGKSSLVASFLSPAGAARVLRGTAQKQATFRFTLWLPAAWGADARLQHVLNQAFTSVFGAAPEPLPLDPEAAFSAQNASQSLHIPLIAWDPRLDDLKIGLLDCPDIQKCPAGADAEATDLRYTLLKKAARLCAATILVLRYENATTVEFRRVSDAFPGQLHLFAFNQIRDLPAHDALREVSAALALPPDALCYGAYDYDLRRYEKYTPAWDPNLQPLAAGASAYPCFFRLTPNATESLPEHIHRERSLQHLAGRLDRQALVREFHIESRRRLRTLVEQSLGEVIAQIRKQDLRLRKACEQVWESCHESLSCPEGQRIILSATMAQDFADAVMRCAPWYIKAPLWAKASVSAGALRVAEFGRAFTPHSVARYGRMIGLAASKLKSAFVKSSQVEEPIAAVFARLLATRWRAARRPIEDTQIRAVTERTFERFNEVGLNNLPREKWDDIAIAFWKEAPRGRAGLTTALSLLAALGLLIYTAFEPVGGSVLIAFSLGKTLLALTIKELFVAVGLGALVGTACALALQRNLEAELGPLQKARFFALACDELGLPRDYPVHAPPDTALPLSLNRDGICLTTFGLRREELLGESERALREQLEKL